MQDLAWSLLVLLVTSVPARADPSDSAAFPMRRLRPKAASQPLTSSDWGDLGTAQIGARPFAIKDIVGMASRSLWDRLMEVEGVAMFAEGPAAPTVRILDARARSLKVADANGETSIVPLSDFQSRYDTILLATP